MDLVLTKNAEHVKSAKIVTAVDHLTDLVRDDLTGVNELIVARMSSSVSMIPAVAGYLINAGGKRLRPLITLASARLCGYTGADHIKLAATVEFIHTATLLHDDVVDESDLRRGRASANTLWGNQASVLVGDFLFSRSFNLMVEVGDIKILDILSNASSVIAEGEVMQLASTADLNTTLDTYLEIISSKTAALFSAAARVGGVVADVDEKQEKALVDFGENLGIAFQLVDDALDYSGKQAALGKTIGDDFREGKITMPVVLAFEKGDEQEKAFWRRVIEADNQKDDDLAHAIELMARHRTLDATMELAREYGRRARLALSSLPENAYRDALDGIINFSIERDY